MKQPTPLIRTAILAAVLTAAFLLTLTATAALPAPAPAQGATAEAAPPAGDILIALASAPLDPREIPADLNPEQAQAYARDLTYRQAEPLLAELERLRAAGCIAGFAVRPDLHGIAVQAAAPAALDALRGRAEIAAVQPLTTDEPPACAAASAQALADQVSGLSRPAAGAAGVRAAGPVPQATDPSINAYVTPGATDNTWTRVDGQTTPDSTVMLRILRTGSVVVTQSASSSSSGYYSFYPSWQNCPTSGYNWRLRPGDVVEVTAHGSTVTTVVANLSAWVDPVADTVAGKTDPGRTVQVDLYDYDGGTCSGAWHSKSISAGGSGSFAVSFAGTVDFDRRGGAYVNVLDARGNSTYYYFYAYRINAYFDYNTNSFQGYLKPGVSFTATLRRLGDILATVSGTSGANNYYSGSFNSTFSSPIPIQSGDVVEVSGGDVAVQYTATGLDVTLDPAAEQAAGVTAAGRPVQANFYKGSGGSYLQTACSSSSRCASTTAGGDGAFTLPAGMDLVRGDRARFYAYDAEGNYQSTYGYRSVPAIVAWPDSDRIAGYWGRPGVYLTVTLKDSGGGVKATRSGIWTNSYDGQFSTYMGSIAIPGDIVEVTDGATAETMTVSDLTARLDGGTGRLTGAAASGHLLAYLYDYRREINASQSYCQEIAAAGPYDLAFSGAQVGGRDEADVWNTGPDGHYTIRHAPAFSVVTHIGDGYSYGYSETPFTPVTVTLTRGGSPIGNSFAWSSSSGYFNTWLNSGTITQGDALQVQTGDGDSVSLVIPELTANINGPSNSIYGKSPANQPVEAWARHIYNGGWYSASRIATANDTGNYSASFSGLYWSRDCSAVDVGHRCTQPGAYYTDPAGHTVYLEGPNPLPVGPDAYEPDNTSAAAQPYTGVQSHTFHAAGESDWVSFTVRAEDVVDGVVYRIETFNLGWSMATGVRLYDAGMSWQSEWWGYENKGRGISIQWTPTAAGVYYLEIVPPGDSYTAYCDAAYDLRIFPVRGQIFLPLMLKQ